MSATRPVTVFLSHSGIDGVEALQLKRRLENSVAGRAIQLQVWLDIDGGLVPGAVGWQKQIADAIEISSVFVVYVGSKGVVNWVESEVEVGLSRATRDKIAFIPVLSSGASSSTLPAFARRYQAVRDPLNDERELSKLLQAILGTAEKPRVVEQPFVGLRAMTEQDAAIFFGRNTELAELEQKLAKSKFVAVVADSGSGKSSLVRAGLIPRYRGGVFADRRSQEPDAKVWNVVMMRPGASPIDGLRMAVTVAAEQRGLLVDEKNALRNSLDFENPQQTAYALQGNLPTETTETLLVVDQFEELFTQTPLPQREPFISWLLGLISTGTFPSFRVVLTIRSDHFNLCSAYPALFAIVNNGDVELRLKAITEQGLADIVEKPLLLAGHSDKGEQGSLIRQIMQQSTDRAGDLALVQMALYEAWSRLQLNGGDLLESFVSVGGVTGALANAAEEVRTAKLEPAEQQVLEAVLVRLVVLGEAAGATRRTALLDEFGTVQSPKRQLINKLADGTYGRLLLTGSDSVEICHEQLVTQWPWWQTWINVHALDMRRLARLMGKTRDWLEAHQEQRSDFSATGSDLQIFSQLATSHEGWLSDSEKTFIDASRKQSDEWDRQDQETRDRERRLRKQAEENARKAKTWLLIAATAACFLGVAFVGIGWALKNANQERGRADAEAANAIVQTQHAQQETRRATENETRALVALSRVALAEGQANDAAKLALAAWPRSTDETERPQLESALEALSSSLAESTLYEKEITNNLLEDMRILKAGDRALSWSSDDVIRLWDIGSGAEVLPPMRHGSPVSRINLALNGADFLSWSRDDGTLKAWSLISGKQIGPVMHHEDLEGANISDDSTSALSWSESYESDFTTIRLWNVLTGQQRGQDFYLKGTIRDAIFVQNGKVLSWFDDENSLLLLDPLSNTQIAALEHDNSIEGMKPYHAGMRVLTWSRDKIFRWEMSSGKQIGLPLVAEPREGSKPARPFKRVKIFADGSRVASMSFDGTINVWDLVSGSLLWTASGGDELIALSADFIISPDEKLLISWFGSTIKQWDISSGKSRSSEIRLPSDIGGLTLALGGSHILSWSYSGDITLSDIVYGTQNGPVLHHDQLAGVLTNENGTITLSWSEDGRMRVWSNERGRKVLSLRSGLTKWILISRDRSKALWYDEASELFPEFKAKLGLYDVSNGKLVGTVMNNVGKVEYAALSNDAKRLIATSASNILSAWDVFTGQGVGPTMHHITPIKGVLLTGDGTRGISWEEKTVNVWDLVNANKSILSLKYDKKISGVTLTDNDKLLIVRIGKNMEIRRADDGQLVVNPISDKAKISGAIALGGGTKGLSWSGEQLQLWNLGTGEVTATSAKHDDKIKGLILAQDETRAVSWSDKIMRVWKLDTLEQVGPEIKISDTFENIKGVRLNESATLALSISDDSVRLWDLATRKQIGGTMSIFDVEEANFSFSERYVTARTGNRIDIWNIDWPQRNNLMDLVCDMLSDDDKTTFQSRYGLEIKSLICGTGDSIAIPNWEKMIR
jgi:WD40 repeat protein/energy-coupling factor transporter ATP-binding protein EcfA2